MAETEDDVLRVLESLMPEDIIQSKWDVKFEWLLKLLVQSDDKESEASVFYIKYNILRFLRSSIVCADKEIQNLELI